MQSPANRPGPNLAVPFPRWQNTDKPILIAVNRVGWRVDFSDSRAPIACARLATATKDRLTTNRFSGRNAIETAKQRTALSPREQVAASARMVVKLGTNVLMRDDGGV